MRALSNAGCSIGTSKHSTAMLDETTPAPPEAGHPAPQEPQENESKMIFEQTVAQDPHPEEPKAPQEPAPQPHPTRNNSDPIPQSDDKQEEDTNQRSGSAPAEAPKSTDDTHVQEADPANPDLQQQMREQETTRLMWLSLPENDQSAYYSDPDEEETPDYNDPGPSQYTNRNHKLRTKDGMRWIHRGKLGDWTEARAERELQEREERRIDAFQHASVEALLEAEAHMPGGLGGIWREPPRFKRRRVGLPTARRNKLRTDSLDPENDLLGDDLDEEERLSLSAATLAPSLLLPVLSPRDLLQSKLLKQIFCNPHITALSRTALDLRESEHAMNRALGRCFGAMERIFDSDPRELDTTAIGSLHKPQEESEELAPVSGARAVEQESKKANAAQEEAHAGSEAMEQDPVPEETKEEPVQKQDEPVQPPSESRAPPPPGPMDITPPLAQINNLFLTKEGLTIPVPESMGEAGEGNTLTLSEEDQREIVYGSLESLNDLYSDSREYMERLEEVRAMLADVEWHRGHIWNILRSWASKKDNEEYQATKMYRDARKNMHNVPGGPEVMMQNYDHDTSNAGVATTTSAKGNRGSEYGGSSSRRGAKRRSGR